MVHWKFHSISLEKHQPTADPTRQPTTWDPTTNWETGNKNFHTHSNSVRWDFEFTIALHCFSEKTVRQALILLKSLSECRKSFFLQCTSYFKRLLELGTSSFLDCEFLSQIIPEMGFCPLCAK